MTAHPLAPCDTATPVTTGTIWGVGIGPGDAELMSVRADRLIRGASHVAYFRKAGRDGQARRIIAGLLRPDAVEIPLEYPVTTEIPLSDPRYNAALSGFYAESCARLAALSDAGRDVVVAVEGDPFFYGSFMHLHSRLAGRCPVQVVPGITGMSAAWTATGIPITWGCDVMTTLMGTLSEDRLVREMQSADAIVVMKIGRNIAKIRRALARAGRLDAAWLIEHAAMPDQKVTRLVEAGDRVTPYFSIVLVHGQGRRP